MILGLLFTFLAPLFPCAVAQPLIVRHIDEAETEADTRNQYFIELLDLALSKTEGLYQLVPSTLTMYQGRALLRLQKGQDLDVLWTMTSAEREQMPGLRAIRIPLQKGLIGVRLFLINAADKAADKAADNAADSNRFCGLDRAALQALKAGQGHDWPDTAILRANHFALEAVTKYSSLFPMLAHNRFDYFPRSVLEIWAEAERFADLGLVIEPCLALRYPAYVYFFVQSENAVLAERLEAGLLRAMADGSFEALFQRYFGPVLARAQLESRHVFTLENPLLPLDAPMVDVSPIFE